MMKKITQMPIVLIPVHFDIDPLLRDPFCQRSVVLRPFLTNDFMTGVAAQPSKDIPLEVNVINFHDNLIEVARKCYVLVFFCKIFLENRYNQNNFRSCI